MAARIPQVGRGAHANLTLHRRKKLPHQPVPADTQATRQWMQPCEKRVDVGAVNGLMAAVIEGHLSDHVIKEPAEAQRQEDPDAVMQVIKSYLQS
ncbi:hypothetical protein [Ralstonia sp. PBBBR1]|nr:hypothetical protein [Ralstonia sp. PBBBR1]